MGDTSFLDYVLEQLSEARGIKTRAMFGGTGIYMGESFFGIVHKGSLYFRTDDASRPAYVKAGSKPFDPKGRAALLRAPAHDWRDPGGRATQEQLPRNSAGRPARGAGRGAGKVAKPPSYEIVHRYYEVPAHVLDDSEELLTWAKRACKTRD